MKIKQNASLAEYTSFKCGGTATKIIICEDKNELVDVLKKTEGEVWILGFGTNVLISDNYFDGTVIVNTGGEIKVENGVITADAGAWWDDLVIKAIENNLWGVELTSGIPSSVGAAVTGNIAAYGQQVSDVLYEIEVFDRTNNSIKNVRESEIEFSYRNSSLQTDQNYIVVSASFQLSKNQTKQLSYYSALKVAKENNLSINNLSDLRKIILITREKAGSLYDPKNVNSAKTAGSFFKNPVVAFETAKKIAKFDETGKSLERILEQNKVHGGESTRVSAAHVLLAAGYKRGQSWGNVRLHPDHILKIENTGSASAQEIYDVANEIIKNVKNTLGITLTPEVKYLGSFK